MEQKQINTKTLYTIIADTMPTEGRDFTIDVTYNQTGKPTLVIKPLTAVGRGFVPALLERLSKPMGEQGVTLSTDGAAAQELVTINTLREQAEREAAATVAAKLEAVEKELDEKRRNAEALTRARIEKLGEKSPRTPEEVNALKDTDETRRYLWRLTQIAERIPQLRSDINQAARNVAADEEQKGEPWAVDMDAPITTLFDRQDVLNTFRRREDLVQRLAELVHDADDVRLQAVHTTKKYALPKNKE